MAEAVKWRKAPQFGKSYHFARDIMNPKTARDYCASLGGRMLLPQSKEENDFICDNFKQADYVWLDIQKSGAGKFKRFNGKKIKYANYTDLLPIELENCTNAYLLIGGHRKASERYGDWIPYAYPLMCFYVICEKDLKAGKSDANKGKQLVENDNAIRNKLDSMSNLITSKFDQFNDSFTQMSTRVNSLESKLDSMMDLLASTAAKVDVLALKAEKMAAKKKEEDANLLFETLDN